MVAVGDEIDLVARPDLVVRRRHVALVVVDDTDNGDAEVGKELGQLAQRRVQDRAVIGASEADDLHQTVGQRYHVEGARHLKPAADGAADLHLRRNDDVDRHVVAAEQVGPDRVEIARLAHPGDLGRHLEKRVSHLAGDHVDLIGAGDRYDHIGVGGAGRLQHVGMGSKPFHRLDIEGIAQLPDKFRRLVDDRHVIVLRRQGMDDAGAHLAGAANDHFHGVCTLDPAPIRPGPFPRWRYPGT